MHEIILRQHDAARKMDGKGFVLGIAGILLRLAVAQMLCNALISLTGVGLINLAFYLYAVWLLIAFMRETVAGYVYTLKKDTLVLERKLGDSTITVVEVPLGSIASLRPVYMGENLHISYRDVMHIDASSKPPVRVRAAFIVSLFSSRLARLLAGKRAHEAIGHVIVYDEGKLRRACTFCPNEELLEKLGETLGECMGFDERMTRARVKTLYGRALERAFPALYPYVEPLIRREDVEWARKEIEQQKAERQSKRNPKKQEAPKAEHADTAEGQEANSDAPRRRRKQG